MPPPPYLHTLALPTPFPVGPVNVYLAEGDPLTLIDSGPKAPVSREALVAGLAAHGYRLEDIRQLILTHHHVDHIGLAGEIVACSGARLLTHPYNVNWLMDCDAERSRQEPFYLALWSEAGVPADLVAAMRAANTSSSQWTDNVPPTGTLDEGDLVTLGGEPWQVFHTPGHAGGLICLWEPTSRTLLANDHFIRDISSNPVVEPPPGLVGPRPQRLVEYLHHMRRMAALGPSVALPGHGPPVTEVAALVHTRQRFHERRAQRIAEVVTGRAADALGVDAAHLPALDAAVGFLSGLVREVLGHLDLLEAAGQVAPLADGSLVRWSRVPVGVTYTTSHDLPTA